MALESAQLIGLLRGLVDESPQRRWEHANAVTDLRSDMDLAELHCVALVLAALIGWETDGRSREAQLHALAELHEWDATPHEAVELVRRVDRTTLTGSEVEYVEWLAGG